MLRLLVFSADSKLGLGRVRVNTDDEPLAGACELVGRFFLGGLIFP